ncbi:baseplate wedge subunit [uncultured Caudovirales phage]|uniref:Baseplate wedge subunit n=1 Tax=uncultured Caudovirales phage TaxID=2100421 RepID=A0A6J5KVT2_9CAUD|nr:baseplate wedge subunit [uncultured Caudovirales phage]
MYFKNFPSFIYNFDIAGTNTTLLVKDITTNVRFRKELLSNITVYDEYDIVDNETPEHISEKIYGTPEYFWVIMLANERYDYINDFPLTQYVLEQYISDKYINPYDIHHYVNENGFIVDSSYIGARSITNYDYEYSINESKRRIKIIPRYYIDKIITDYNKII